MLITVILIKEITTKTLELHEVRLNKTIQPFIRIIDAMNLSKSRKARLWEEAGSLVANVDERMS